MCPKVPGNGLLNIMKWLDNRAQVRRGEGSYEVRPKTQVCSVFLSLPLENSSYFWNILKNALEIQKLVLLGTYLASLAPDWGTPLVSLAPDWGTPLVSLAPDWGTPTMSFGSTRIYNTHTAARYNGPGPKMTPLASLEAMTPMASLNLEPVTPKASLNLEPVTPTASLVARAFEFQKHF